MLKRIGAEKNGELKAIASGTLPNGVPVIVNSNGTVSVISQSNTSEAKGSDVAINSVNSFYFGAAYDAFRQKVLIGYSGTSAYGTVAVGTVSGNAISFETPVVFNSSHTRDVRIVFDTASNKNVFLYRDNTASTVNSIVGSIDSSGTITFGSAATLASGSSNYLDLGYDSTNNKVIAVYQIGADTSAQVGTVSGTSISYGTAVVFENNYAQYNGITYDTANQKVVISYRHGGNSGYGTAIVGTVSGTSISFGTKVVYNSASTTWQDVAYDPVNQKIVLAYNDQSTTGYAVIGTVSGTSISFATPVTFASSGSYTYISCVYHTAAKKTAILFATPNPDRYLSVRMATVSGTSISLSTIFTLNSAKSYYFERGAAYDSNNKKIVIGYTDEGDSNYATAIVYQPSYLQSTLTSENYIGMSRGGAVADTKRATVNIKNSINDEQSGLTAGQQYFVQNNGTISTTADDPSVLAGVAISATELLIKG